jgi:abnormal spindle-like microcephaly-associated protein
MQPDNHLSDRPKTPRGLCMDLTNIFIDAAATKTSVKCVTRVKTTPSLYKRACQSPVSIDATGENAQTESDDWANKQCEAFSQWLNYTFQPTEEYEHDETDFSLDRIALRSLVVHRRMARARSESTAAFKGPEMTKVRAIISSEIRRGRIAIRKDRNMHADLTMRNQIMTLLFSYSTPWLRLALETLFDEPILPTDSYVKVSSMMNSNLKVSNRPPISRMKLALKNFIIGRVLSDDKILAKYTKGKCLVPSGSFEKKYNSELNAVILNRLLVLIMFLDNAKRIDILDKVPNLFIKDSEVKSTREVLLVLCRDFLQAEGDFVKHLARLGLRVFYKQESVDELNFTVTNLAVDLRDGTRLVKLVEILVEVTAKSLLSQLRLPVVSRLQKLHNVGIALKEMIHVGIPLTTDIAAHHIVDGHRQMVLKLLWILVANCCLRTLLDIEKVEAEIERINQSTQLRQNSIRGGSGENEIVMLKNTLLRWCQAICTRSGVRVDNLTHDFANGKVVCLLINFYHPTLLTRDEISQTTDEIVTPSEEDREKLLENERLNSCLANKRMSQLGGIPAMIPICDSENIPEEKSMVFCLTFLCSRLIESSREIRACLVIQNWFRPHYRTITFARQTLAALTIWKSWKSRREFFYKAQEMKYKDSVRIIEIFLINNRSCLLRMKERREMNQELSCSAAIIQVSIKICELSK